jgi:Protein of unknown function (DUF1697)
LPPKTLTTHVALLRGINVGGKNRLPMKDLVAILIAAGCVDVKTYIQSGNAVCKATSYLHGKRLDLVSLDSKIMDIESRTRTLTGKGRADLDARIGEVLSQRDAFVRHMSALDSEEAATWDSAKANLDKEWDALRNSVDHAND